MKDNLNLGRLLSKSEMKLLTGGDAFSCTFTFADGHTWNYNVQGNNGNAAQCIADAACYEVNECQTVDCPEGEC